MADDRKTGCPASGPSAAEPASCGTGVPPVRGENGQDARSPISSGRPTPSEPVAAVATPPGAGGIAVVRLSGRGAQALGSRLLPPGRALPEERREFLHAVLRHPTTGARIDEAVVLSFPAPHSYTGEPVVEFQVHGGRIPARRVLDALAALGVETAEPGEFTRRAFLNGRIDLSQAEAVMDLVAAETERAANAASEQLDGALSRRVGPLYDALVSLRADVEASLDFDEDEVPSSLSPEAVAARARDVRAGIAALLATWREGRLLREGALVVLSGRPNAGKSSLFNALLAADRAIVSDEPGTTRDLIEERLSVRGVPLRLVDTAGLREAEGVVERQGVRRAEERMRMADVHLRVIDAAAPDCADETAALAALPAAATVAVFAKADLAPGFAVPAGLPRGMRAVRVSAVTGEGLGELREAVADALGAGTSADVGAVVNERHRSLLERASEALGRALALAGGGEDAEGDAPDADGEKTPFDAVLAAQALREAAEALGAITGRDVGEDVLDAVFSRFCVGK